MEADLSPGRSVEGVAASALYTAESTEFRFVQTGFRPPDGVDATEPVDDGDGEGSFVDLRAAR